MINREDDESRRPFGDDCADKIGDERAVYYGMAWPSFHRRVNVKRKSDTPLHPFPRPRERDGGGIPLIEPSELFVFCFCLFSNRNFIFVVSSKNNSPHYL